MGRPRKYERVEDLEKAIDRFFDKCDERAEPYTISALSLALGFESRQTLLNYCEYNDENDKPFLDAIKNAKARCEANVEIGLLSGKYNTTGAIFNLKNNYKWKDKQEIEADLKQETTIRVDLVD